MADSEYLMNGREQVAAAVNIGYDLGEADDRPSFTVGCGDATSALVTAVFHDARRRWGVAWEDAAQAQTDLGDVVWPVADPQYRERLRLGTVVIEPTAYDCTWKQLPHAPPVEASC